MDQALAWAASLAQIHQSPSHLCETRPKLTNHCCEVNQTPAKVFLTVHRAPARIRAADGCGLTLIIALAAFFDQMTLAHPQRTAHRTRQRFVVSRDHQRDAELAIEQMEELMHLVGGLRIEIAR